VVFPAKKSAHSIEAAAKRQALFLFYSVQDLFVPEPTPTGVPIM